MKISKQILLATPILFILFSTGCSKTLLPTDDNQPASGLFEEEQVGEADTSGLYAKPDSRNFGSAKQGVPGNGSAGSFVAEPFGGNKGKVGSDSGSGPEFFTEKNVGEVDTPSRLYAKPDSRNFGSAKQGMPGNGSAGSFVAEPFGRNKGKVGSDSGSGPEFFTEENVGEVNTPSRSYEKPSPRKFESAKQGMPGNGSAGSFVAEPFSGNRGGNALSRLYEKPDSQSFGSAKQGMPSNGSAGSFVAEPFSGENAVVAQLPKEEEVRRQLPYHFTIHLQDIHFAFDKYDLTDKSRAILKQNADYLNAHPSSRIEIQGHCDERGSNNYNITLGERRAQSTQFYLVSLGVDESRIRTISYGEERPFCFESNEKCWYQNRRGHFLVAD